MDNEKLIHLAPCEEAFAEALVDQMLQVDKWVNNQSEVHHYIYIDSAFDYSCDERDRLCMQDRATNIVPNVKTRLDPSWTSLHRVGLAAADLYCLKAFGKRFDDIANVDKRGVLRVLDGIKLVFQDGSHAGVFVAALYDGAAAT